MNTRQVLDTIKRHNGTIDGGINWTWAHFDTEAECKACFELVKAHIEHRGIYPPHQDHKWSFRFR